MTVLRDLDDDFLLFVRDDAGDAGTSSGRGDMVSPLRERSSASLASSSVRIG